MLGNVNNVPETNPPTILTTTVENIVQSISEFFQLESDTQTDTMKYDCYAEQHFKQTHSRSSDGRYIVQYPFVPDSPRLGDNNFKTQRLYLA